TDRSELNPEKAPDGAFSFTNPQLLVADSKLTQQYPPYYSVINRVQFDCKTHGLCQTCLNI
ncbi:hypothetical protein AC626_22525, partial [Pseudoalteromonas rubra]